MSTGTLNVTTPSDREIAMTRVFDAPRALVFDAMTKPEYLKRWLLGPDGWALTTCEVDLRPGGAIRYVWQHRDGRRMGMRGVYREVVRPERTVASERFDDPWYEGEALATNTLVEAKGKTTLTMLVRYDSQQIRDTVLKSGMERGVEVSCDRLAGLLASGQPLAR